MRFGLLLPVILIALFSQVDGQPTITIENVQSITLLDDLTFANATFRDLAFQPDSNVLAVVVRQRENVTTLNGQVVFLDSVDLEPIDVGDATLSANTLTYTQDGTLLAIGSEEGIVSIYDTQTLNVLDSFQAGADIINDIAVSPDKTYIGVTFAIPAIITNGDIAFQLLELADRTPVFSHPLETDIYGGGVTFDDSGRYVIFSTTNFATNNGSVYVEEVGSGMELARREGNVSSGRQIAYKAEEATLYYMGTDGIHVVRPFELDSSHDSVIEINTVEETTTTFTIHSAQPILAVGILGRSPTPAGEQLTTNIGAIQLYNTNTGEKLVRIEVPEGAITSLAFNSDGTLLASGGSDGTVRLWGIPAG